MVNGMAHSRARRNPVDGHPPVRRAAATVGVLFLVAGVLGFLPGVTTGFHELYFAGHGSAARLFGVFQVSALHNLLHLIFGVAGLALARTVPGARHYLVAGGAVYLVLWLYGLAVHSGTANVIPVNAADNWLHLALGIGMVVPGVLTVRAPARR